MYTSLRAVRIDRSVAVYTPRGPNGMKETRARGIMYTSLRAVRIDRSVGRADDSPHTPTTMRRATAATTATTAATGRARVSRRARARATRWTATRRRAARDETGRATIGNRRGGGAMDGARAARDDGATRATGEKREETATRWDGATTRADGARRAPGGGRAALLAALALAASTGALATPRAANAGTGDRVKTSTVVGKRAGAMRALDEFDALRGRVRKTTTDAMRTSLQTVGDFMGRVEAKTQEDWHIEDVWVLVAWNWCIRRGREKLFEAAERAKNALNPSRTPKTFRGSFLDWFRQPMQLIQALFVLSYAFDVGCDMIDQLSTEWDIPDNIKLGFDKGSYTFATGILVVMVIQNYGPRLLGRFFPSIRYDASLQLVITRLTSAFVVVATLMLTLAAFGIPAQVLFSFGGLGGLAFGLAAKDFISNLIGGLVLAVMRPFKVGEKIYLTGGGGKYRDSKEKDVSNYKVDEIGWYQTRLIPKDGKVTTIPNGYFLGANVINTSREPNEFVGPQLRIAIPDYEGIPALTEEITTFLTNHPDVHASYKPPLCVLKKIDVDHLSVQIELFMYGDAHYGKKIWKKKRELVLIDLLRIVKKHCPNSPALPVSEVDGYVK